MKNNFGFIRLNLLVLMLTVISTPPNYISAQGNSIEQPAMEIDETDNTGRVPTLEQPSNPKYNNEIIEPADPTENGLVKEEIIARYLAWFFSIKMLAVFVVGWVVKFILRKSLPNEKRDQLGKWVAMVIFIPGFLVSLIIETTSGQIDIITAIAVFMGVATAIGLHTAFLNPIEKLFKKDKNPVLNTPA